MAAIAEKAQEEYLTPAEAASFLGIKLNTLYKMALDRRLSSYKIGKLRRFKRTDLVSTMECNRVEAVKCR